MTRSNRRALTGVGIGLGLTLAFAALPDRAEAQGVVVETGGVQNTRSFAQPRIINGQNVRPGEGPSAVALYDRNGNFFCGGTLLAPEVKEGLVTWTPGAKKPEWVVTAAHCFYPRARDGTVTRRDTDGMSVFTGAVDRPEPGADSDLTNGEMVPVTFVMEHEAYDLVTFANDVALLRLAEPLEDIAISRRASAAMPDPADYDALYQTGRSLWPRGWGVTETGKMSMTLKEVAVPVYDTNLCARQYERINGVIEPGMFCAGFSGGRHDSCQGDSGGGIVDRAPADSGEPSTLVGIVSWGKDCALAGYPGVYSSIAHFRPWLEAKVSACKASQADCTTRVASYVALLQAQSDKGSVATSRAAGDMISGRIRLNPLGCETDPKVICRLGSVIRFVQASGIAWESDVWTSNAKQSGTTDGASIPGWAQIIVGKPFDRTYLKAAILHDHYCYRENHVRPFRDVHRMFLDAMLASGVKTKKAFAMYLAVQAFGPRWTKIVDGEDCKGNCVKQLHRENDGGATGWEAPLYDQPAARAALATLESTLRDDVDVDEDRDALDRQAEALRAAVLAQNAD